MSDENNSRFCLECGLPVEPGVDFCYGCGSTKVVDVNRKDNSVVIKKGKCPFCGFMNEPDARFCAGCNERMGDFEYFGRRRKLTSFDYLVIAATVLPGAFNVFGLGHILLRKYSRALMYLVISAVLLYVRWFTPDISLPALFVLELIGLAVFLKQAMEVLREIQRRQGGS